MAQSDPLAGLLTCTPGRAWYSIINGRVVVDKGELVGVDEGKLVAEHNAAARGLLARAGLA